MAKTNIARHTKWSRQIKKRDLHCQKCMSNENLVAHHIKSWMEYPELRFNLDNGMTLCTSCHKSIRNKKNESKLTPILYSYDKNLSFDEGQYGYWNLSNLKIRKGKKYYIICKCKCGIVKSVERIGLLNGRSQSCGCKKKQNLKFIFKNKNPQYKHGQSRKGNWTKEYRCWVEIKTRCLNEKNRNYENYGGRGITMSQDWINNFEKFYNDIGKAPSSNHSIDRINVNGNYEKNNCRWVTNEENCSNKRCNKFLTVKELKKTYAQWEKLYNFKPGTIRRRILAGWSNDECLLPIGTKK